MTEKTTELKVTAVKNGTVIDHIAAGEAFKVFQLLGLEGLGKTMTIGVRLQSKSFERKDILKIEDYFISENDSDKIALVAPDATINIIKDWNVVSKRKVSTPKTFTGLACANPRCVTRNDKLETRFTVIDKEKLKIRCYYCEHTFDRQELVRQI